MTSVVEPFSSILNYGWAYGENGWNTGMDSNMVNLGLMQHISVVSDTLTAPPTLVNGQRFIVGAGATGAWLGQDHNLAGAVGGVWTFLPPQEGWRYKVTGTNGLWKVYVGGAWVQAPEQGAVQWQQSGTNVGTAGGVSTVNLTGSGVSTSLTGSDLTVTITGGGGGSITSYNTAQVFAVPGTYATLTAAITAFEDAVWLNGATCQIQIAQGTTLSEQITLTHGDYSALSIVALGTGITVNNSAFTSNTPYGAAFLGFLGISSPNVVGTINLTAPTSALTVICSGGLANINPITGTTGLTTNAPVTFICNGSISYVVAGSGSGLMKVIASSCTLPSASLSGATTRMCTLLSPSMINNHYSYADTIVAGTTAGTSALTSGGAYLSSVNFNLAASTGTAAIVCQGGTTNIVSLGTITMPTTAQTFEFLNMSGGTCIVGNASPTWTGVASTGKRYNLGASSGSLVQSNNQASLSTWFTGGDSQTINTISANGLILGA